MLFYEFSQRVSSLTSCFNLFQVEGEVVEISPYNACSDIVNREEMQDRIAIARRGDCMFIDKVYCIAYNQFKLAIQ